MSQKHMSRADVLKIGSFMETIVSKPKKPGDYISYSSGWDDEKVGQRFGYPAQSIARFRKEVFGNLAPGAGSTPVSLLWERLSKLEARVNALEAQKNGSAIDDEDIIQAQDRRAYSL